MSQLSLEELSFLMKKNASLPNIYFEEGLGFAKVPTSLRRKDTFTFNERRYFLISAKTLSDYLTAFLKLRKIPVEIKENSMDNYTLVFKTHEGLKRFLGKGGFNVKVLKRALNLFYNTYPSFTLAVGQLK